MATKNVVINFEVNNEQIISTVDLLEKLGTVDRQTAESFRKATADYAARQKAVTDLSTAQRQSVETSKQTVKSIEDLSNASKNLKQNLATAALIEMSKEVQDGINDALKEAGVTVDEFENKLTELFNNPEKFDINTKPAEENAKSLRAQLRLMKEDLTKLEDQGKENTQEFQDLAVAAAKLEDQIGDTNSRIRALASDTFTFDAINAGLNGLVGGFSAAQGAAALFGNENKDLQETLVKLNALIAISTGLAQVKNTLEKQSAAVQAFSLLQQRAQIAATSLDTAATSSNIVVKYAAIAAQKALNAVQALSPAGALALAVGALVLAYKFLTEESENATEKQIRLNEEEEKHIKILEKQNEIFNRGLTEKIKELELNIEKRKAEGASVREISKLELELSQQRARLSKVNQSFFNADKDSIEALEKQIIKTAKGLQALDNIKPTDIGIPGISTGITQEQINEQKEKQQKLLDQLQQRLDRQKALYEKAADEGADADRKEIEDKKLNFKLLLEDEKAAIDARVLLAKVGSDERLKAEIDAINKKKEIELANETSPEKRKLIEIQTAQEISEKKIAFATREIDAQKKINEAKLISIQEGSKAELDLKIANIKLSADAELKQTNLTERERAAIIIARDNNIAKLTRDNLIANQERQLAFERESISLRLAVQREGSAEQLELQKDALESQADVDKLAAQNTISNKTQLAQRIREIDEATAKAKRDLDDQVYVNEIDEATNAANRIIELENNKLQAKLNDPNLDVAAKKALQDQILANERQLNQNSVFSLREKFANQLIDEKEYRSQLAELKNQADILEIESERAKAEELKAIRQEVSDFIFQSSQQVTDLLFSNARDQDAQLLNYKLQNLDKNREAELANKNLSEDQKRKINDKYAKEEARLKIDAAKKQREADITQAAINGALALTKVAVQFPPPSPQYFLGTATVLLNTGLQIAAIQSKPIPQFFKGTEYVKRGDNPVGRDTIPAMLNEGERILPTDVNSAYTPALNVIQRKQISPDIANDLLVSYAKSRDNFNFKYSVSDDVLNKVQINNNFFIDEKKIGEVVSREIQNHLDGQRRENQNLVKSFAKEMQEVIVHSNLKENSYR